MRSNEGLLACSCSCHEPSAAFFEVQTDPIPPTAYHNVFPPITSEGIQEATKRLRAIMDGGKGYQSEGMITEIIEVSAFMDHKGYEENQRESFEIPPEIPLNPRPEPRMPVLVRTKASQ